MLLALLAGVFCGGGLVLFTGDARSAPVAKLSAIEQSPLTDRQKAVHLLSRLTYGLRPGDVEHVQKVGLQRFIEQQLRPQEVDDSDVQRRLEPLETVHMPVQELVQLFPRPGLVRRLVEDGLLDEEHLPSRLFPRNAQNGEPSQAERKRFSKGFLRPEEKTSSMETDTTRTGWGRRGGNPIYRPITRLPEPVQLPGRLGRNRPPLEGVNPQAQIVMQLQAAKLIRTVHSKRQLDEVMVDFWMNHFNVFIRKGPEPLLVPSYEREVIRPHALGNFRELVGATAKSPAMLLYLDNAQSVSPDSPLGRRRDRGLNENYARELMELHTLGVDGGYTQQDVVEVAKAFTGWTVFGGRGRGPAGFRFLAAAHAPGDKKILGHTIREAGMEEGEKVLDLLAQHPSTARFIATKLVRRFVADDPPNSLVTSVAATYRKTSGDIRAMLRTIFYSPEFWSKEAFQAKAKKPLEFVAAAIRAVDGDLTPTPMLLATMQRLGEPLYLCQPPTGYPDVAGEWLNTGTLLYRWNFALGIASGKVPGIKIWTPDDLEAESAEAVLMRLSEDLLHGQMSAETRSKIETVLEEQLSRRADPEAPLRTREVQYIAGLVLGSPEFQRR